MAQRIGTIRDADLILVLDNGKVVGQGTHREPLESCEVYRQIALSQLSKGGIGTLHNPHLKPHLPSQPVNLKSAWGKLLAFARLWLPISITGPVCGHGLPPFSPLGSG
ncbi:MAG: hypothetical protein ACLSHU_12430 [Oscillospiraceae bacterium]